MVVPITGDNTLDIGMLHPMAQPGGQYVCRIMTLQLE